MIKEHEPHIDDPEYFLYSSLQGKSVNRLKQGDKYIRVWITLASSEYASLKTNLLIFNHKKIRFSGGIITVSASISDSNMTPEKDSISYQVPERPH